jgi:hypothetical protein
MAEVVVDIVDKERRRRLFDRADAAYARLRSDPVAWAEYQAELGSMEGTLLDGLEDDSWIAPETELTRCVPNAPSSQTHIGEGTRAWRR